MFRITTETLSLPFPGTQIGWKGFDVGKDGNWLAILQTETGLKLRSEVGEVALPVPLSFAIVRCLGDLALVVAARIERQGEVNAWIMETETGRVRHAFSVGDGVQDVLVLADFIVISYFDEGVFSGIMPSHEGLAFFDRQGTYLWGYVTGITDSVDVSDCYAMCHAGRNHVAFCAYTTFSLVVLDISRREQSVVPTPQQLHGCGAITTRGDGFLFRGPYPDDADYKKPRDSVFAFDAVSGEATLIGTLPGQQVRGLSNGRMLCVDGDDVVIASFTR